MAGRIRLALLGVILILVGGLLAARIQTAGGIELRDIRIPLGDGTELGAYLYVPPNARSETPAPGILAVHGYINSRETQSPFAIELARRGHVVLALDQSGHGTSTNAAFAAGFGGPAGLTHLRSLPFVDPDRIGMEGHSMGGWTALAAAAALPDAYRAVALVGSSTGAPFAAEGTPEFPRNAAVIFSLYDEFAPLMWGVDRAAAVADSAKLQTLFGTDGPVEPRRVYGRIEDGTARWLTQPDATHPGDHLSHEAVSDVLDWMDRTLGAPTPKPNADQIWIWKEVGTLIALIGAGVLLIGIFGAGHAQVIAPAMARDIESSEGTGSGAAWWIALALAVIVPAATYFPVTGLGESLAGLAFLRQNITTQIMAWALVNGVVAGIALITARGIGRSATVAQIILVLVAVLLVYAAVTLSQLFFQTDMRFWVVALKPMSAHHLPIFATYFLPFFLFFYASHASIAHGLVSRMPGAIGQYAVGWLASAGGITLLIGAGYALLFTTGRLTAPFDRLFTIIGMQFIPVLTFTGVVAVFTWRRTGSALPGALMSGLVVTWYIVAGQATHG